MSGSHPICLKPEQNKRWNKKEFVLFFSWDIGLLHLDWNLHHEPLLSFQKADCGTSQPPSSYDPISQSKSYTHTRVCVCVCMCMYIYTGLHWCLSGRGYTSNEGNSGLIPGPGRCPGKGIGNPLQYSCLENSIHRGAW